MRLGKILIPVVGIAGIPGAALAQQASSQLVDWGSLATNIQTDVTAAITSIIPLLGLILGALVAWRLFRRFTGGR